MTARQIRDWLGLYFLLTTGMVGSFILLFGKSVLRLDDVSGTFQIIIPVLVGQLAMIFKWYATDPPAAEDNRRVPLPTWIIKGPPFMVAAILVVASVTKIAGFHYDRPDLAPSDEQFKGVVTFCVALLNATTIYFIARYFSLPAKSGDPAESPQGGKNR